MKVGNGKVLGILLLITALMFGQFQTPAAVAADQVILGDAVSSCGLNTICMLYMVCL